MLIPRLDKVFIYTCNGKYSKKDIKRFLSHIRINTETGCWEWTGRLCNKGYGRIDFCKYNNKITYFSHRVSYEIFYGISILKEIFVLHKCDNPKCCNPNHLKIGTQQDNMNDKVNRGRQASGENNGMSKFTWEIVNKIRRLKMTGNYTNKQLADIFNSGTSSIYDIINNRTWKI